MDTPTFSPEAAFSPAAYAFVLAEARLLTHSAVERLRHLQLPLPDVVDGEPGVPHDAGTFTAVWVAPCPSPRE